ncbi:translocation/assembly module TamB domain-containing protein [Commensalibacter oyaizuii]|uniref:Translocation/assembly module TamB domain-containing protein n=1 Tax=Commensalibacter oyaizuii TaxID=3043873 RepID=A0ABT6PYB3_9PROT|nr:translocation/assembly module TamB domain-containing protein [Commensalibacter sp. TBRC 16381]MDI2089856.1 translocation/assembly module TamB domain-containing protein [Commensalibacter sp. TBRC 16381]
MRPSDHSPSSNSPNTDPNNSSGVRRKWRQRHRILWVLSWLVGSVIGLIVVAITGVMIFVNTQKGQDYIASQIGNLTGHSVEVTGLSGSFPNHLRVALIKLNDPKIGTWLSLKQTELDWSLWALFAKKVSVDRLYAKEINVYALPPSSGETTQSAPLPDIAIAANIRQIQIDKLFVSNKVAPIDLNVGIQGQVAIQDVMKIAGFKAITDLSNIHLAVHLWELNQATDLQLKADIGDHQINQGLFTFAVKKQADGMVEKLLKTEQLLPLSLNVALHGPYDQIQTDLKLFADTTNLTAKGGIDLIHSKMNVFLKGQSPALTLSPEIGWGGWNIDAHVHGPFAEPAGNGLFKATNLVAGDAMINRLSLQFEGKNAQPNSVKNNLSRDHNPDTWAFLQLVADGLRIPGSHPTLLAGYPLALNVMYLPKAKNQQVNLELSHHLLQAKGTVFIKPALNGHVTLNVPNLSPLASLGGVDLKGHTTLDLGFAMPTDPKKPIQLDLDGPLAITGGMPVGTKLIGAKGLIGLHAQVIQGTEQQVTLQEISLKGSQINLNATGSLIAQQVKGLLKLDIKELSALSPILKGKATAELHVDGILSDLAARLKLSTNLSTLAKSGYALRPSQLDLTANVQHLPTLPQVDIALVGQLDQSPVNIKLQGGMRKEPQEYYVKLQQMEWRGIKAVADVVMSQKTLLPIGKIKLDVMRLSDFSKLINQKIDGTVHLDVHTTDQGTPKVMVDLKSKINMPQVKIGQLSLAGSINNPIAKPDVNLKLQASQVQAPQVKGNATVTAAGGMESLKLTAQGSFPSLMDAKGNLDTALTLNLTKQNVAIQKLTALVKGETIRLLSPVKAEFGEKIGLDRLRLSVAPMGASPAMIDIAGNIKPKLALAISIQNVTPALAKPFVPDLKAQGVMNAQAKLNGTIEKPQGSVQLTAQNMRLLSGNGASLPPAQLTALVNLNGNTAQLNTRLNAGQKINTTIQGTVPLQPKGNLALNLNGAVDLSVANAIVGAFGQQVKGMVNMAMQINGNMTSPSITGTVNLANGSFRDYAQGVSIRNMQASIVGQKDRILLQSFTAKAGDGTMSANGQIGIFQPGLPIDIHFGMDKAKPLVSDLMTVILDGDISVKGLAKSKIDVNGVVKIKRAEINIPRSVSRSVVSIKVIRPGDKVENIEETPSTGPEIGLNLTIKSAGQILVRGFGLFTDMAGALKIGGTANAPKISGGFEMKNGHIDLAGISLEFTKGKIGFKGSGVDHKIDPTLDFEVKKSVEGNTVSLLITGYASAPKIALTSSPPISQDRVLAMLLFGVDSQSLSTTQMAEIGVALATLGGESAGFDPIGTVRKTLGLDRLSVGGGNSDNRNGSTSGTSVSAGKYIARGVYLGAKQSTGTAGTQAEVQVDITKRLKATATMGTGKDTSGFVTPDNDPGSSIGLLYQFNY